MNSTINSQARLLFSLENSYKIERKTELEDMVNYSPRANAPIHNWFKYREGYSVDVIDNIISKEDRKILDPFCGCGSTLLSSKKNGVPAIGIDINPVPAFVSNVKTRNYSNENLISINEALKTIILSKSNSEIPVPNLSIINTAFHPEILHYLLKLKYRINQISDTKIRDFVLLGFLSIIESVSNTYKEGNGIKYRFTKRTKNGYIRIPLEKWYSENLPSDKCEFVKSRLTNKINSMISDIQRTNYPKTEIEVLKASSQNLSELVKRNSITLCVFSPPYCNCFDYFEIFKLELWLGEFVRSREELRNVRKQSLRSNTNADLQRPVKEFSFLEDFLELVDAENIWSKRILSVIRGYFTDMEAVLKGILESLTPGGRCVIIVGNSAYGGVLIPTDILLAKISEQLGFIVEKITVARHLTTSSQQKKQLQDVKGFLRESLVCLKK